MSDPYSKLSAGAPVTAFSVTAWNRMLDMLRWWVQNQNSTTANSRGGAANNNIFDIQNNSGDAQPWLGVLGIDDVLYSPVDNPDGFSYKPSLKGVTPTVANHLGKWGVLTSPVADGEIAKIALSGVMPIRVYVSSTGDKFVDVSTSHTVSDETVCVSTGASGFQLLWLDSGSSGTIQWAVVRLGGGGGTTTGSTFVNAMLKADLLAGGLPVQAEIFDDAFQPTGVYISVYDGCLASGAFAAALIVWVELGTKNMVRGSLCINEMESP